MSRLYLSPPDVGPRERELLLVAFDSNWVAPAGPDLALFEEALAERCGRKFAVAMSSGTAAIHLGLLLSGVGPGDHVLVSTFTFAGSINPIVYLGAVPVLSRATDDSFCVHGAVGRVFTGERASSRTSGQGNGRAQSRYQRASKHDPYRRCASHRNVGGDHDR